MAEMLRHPSVRRGRPRKAAQDLASLDKLTLPEVIAYARLKGRPLGRKRLSTALLTRQLPALEDLFRSDRYGAPLLVVRKADLDAWLDSTFRPFTPAPMGAASFAQKGPLPRAL